MKWTVAQLQKYRNQIVDIDQTVDIAKSLTERDSEIRGATPIHVTGTMEVDSNKVEFHLQLTGSLTLPCARTLADTEYPVKIHSSEAFLLEQDSDLLQEEEDDIHEPEKGVVNLLPIIEELVLVDIPMQVFSDEALNDANLSGNDWVVMTEEQYLTEKQKEEKKVDPRLAGLADLLKDQDQ